MFVLGTRPEAIKLASLLIEARQRPSEFECTLVATAQHREMLDDVLRAFGLTADIDLNIMAPGQTLFHITARIIDGMDKVMRDIQPDIVVVQGDTTTTFASALAAYYAQKGVAYVEAGLRTGDKWAPFPEEINRRMTSCVADWHFAPTESARQNLLREGVDPRIVHVTGNTVIDALKWMVARVEGRPCPLAEFAETLDCYERIVLITGHRRESFGEPFQRICLALRELAEAHPKVGFVYPVHLNPNVQKPVKAKLGALPNFHLLPPLPYPDFVWFMQRSFLIITDSGGIQEEAPALGKPVLVTRRVTERPEAVDAGLVKLVGDDTAAIHAAVDELLTDTAAYARMARGESPYGDGLASVRILDIISGEINRL